MTKMDVNVLFDRNLQKLAPEKALNYLGTPAPIAGAKDNQEPNVALGYLGTPALIAGASSNQGLKNTIEIINNFKNPELSTYNIAKKRLPVKVNVEKNENIFPARQKSGRLRAAR